MSAVLLDIEGTTTDKHFVTDVLFPFARERIRAFICSHADEPEVAAAIAVMRAKLDRPHASLEEIGRTLERWIDEDRKEEPLKSLQGLIWADGYADSTLKSHVYRDVPEAFARWQRQGERIAIFSSGSAQAQRLLFGNTEAGDLTPYIEAYFDLSTGPKFEPGSYAKIAKALDLPPSEIRFYSDALREIAAAQAAGMQATLVERDGPIAAEGSFRRIQDFSGE